MYLWYNFNQVKRTLGPADVTTSASCFIEMLSSIISKTLITSLFMVVRGVSDQRTCHRQM